jgi:error-prone DNA polymerase
VPYAELHAHSTFSLLDGAAHPEQLIARAAHLGLAGIALTDHDDLGGAVRFSTAAEELGVHGILGAELTLETPEVPRSHLVLLAQDRTGYGNLCTLITRARLDHPRGVPRVTLDTLAQYTSGLYALTGCMRGWVPQLLAAQKQDAACAATATLLDLFDRRVAIECWDHALPEERVLTRELIALARALDIPWVVTNDVHYADPTGRLAADVLSALRHGATLDEMGTRLRPNGEWYLKGYEQLARRWRGQEEGLRASVAIAEQCTFKLKDMKPTLPQFPLPPGVTSRDYLAQLVEQGADERWGWRRTARHDKQLQHELALIEKLGLSGYFLIVWDIVRFARRSGVLCQGRGSAANSAVCYALGITAVDPIKLDLLFERFLSEERNEPPDIDIDFAHRDRETVLQYVYERYGREHAAMVCEHITWRGRSAVRDAARVLGFSPEQAAVLATFSDRFSAKATAESLRTPSNAADPFAPERSDSGGPASYNKDLEAKKLTEKIAENLGMELMRGTHAVTRMRAERAAARADFSRVPVPVTEEGTSARSVGAVYPLRAALGPRSVGEEHPLRDALGPLRGPAAASLRGRSSPLSPSTDARESEGIGSFAAKRPQGAAGDRELCEEGPDTRAHAQAPSASDNAGSPTILSKAGMDPGDLRVQRLADIVAGLHEAPRHRGIHVGGFVLTEEPLSTVVPIEPASMDERTVIQWEKDDLDPVGLVKIDLLGLGILTVLQDCLKYIRATRGVTLDLGQLDMSDQNVYDDLCRADTVGVFQVESRAQMNTLPRLKPRCFYDIVVEVALIRPGPIQGEMVHPYLRRKAGEEIVTYPHPSLEPILKRTLGVPLFQEQGMQVAIAAAGFTPGEADLLRKAMGHKRSRERMAAICQKMITGMEANGIAPDVAMRIYNQINAFADYGFPESHAASFALLVYASAYLRHYYAAEFLCAMLNAQPMGFYSAGTLVEDAKRHGVKVVPVDATRSAWDHTLECPNGRVVIPHDGVIAVHDASGPRAASTPTDRAQVARVLDPPSQSSRTPAASCGHFAAEDPAPSLTQAPMRGEGGVECPRSDAAAGPRSGPRAARRGYSAPTDRAPERGRPAPQHGDPKGAERPPVVRLGFRSIRGLGSKARGKLELALRDGPFTSIYDFVERSGLDQRALRYVAESGALDGFITDQPPARRRRVALWRVLGAVRGSGGPLALFPEAPVPNALPALSAPEVTEADYRLTGLSLNGHPMEHIRPLIALNGILTARDVRQVKDGARVGVAGLVICRQRPGTAKGFVFLTLEDETGMVNIVITPQRFEAQALLISRTPLLLVRGTVEIEKTVVNVKAEEFLPLGAAAGAAFAKRHDYH